MFSTCYRVILYRRAYQTGSDMIVRIADVVPPLSYSTICLCLVTNEFYLVVSYTAFISFLTDDYDKSINEAINVTKYGSSPRQVYKIYFMWNIINLLR